MLKLLRLRHSSLACILSADVNVPSVRMVDVTEGVLGIEWIEGKSVRFLLGGGAEDEEIVEEVGEADDITEDSTEEKEDPLQEYHVSTGMYPLSMDLMRVLNQCAG